jgi:lipopolysaccharide transport system ATP-binding protein
VDEVLAVGDAEFQKKCLGKMGDVASHGRTIIFVSHNMQAVQALCKSTMYLKSGRVVEVGETDKVINNYLSREITNCMERSWAEAEAPGNEQIRLISAKVVPDLSKADEQISVATRLRVQIEFANFTDNALINLSLFLFSSTGVCIFNLATQAKRLKKGQICFSELEIPGRFLNDNIYSIKVFFVKDTSVVIYDSR